MPFFVLKKGGAGEKTKNPAVTDECEGAGGDEFGFEFDQSSIVFDS